MAATVQLLVLAALTVCGFANFADEFHHRRGPLNFRWLREHLPALQNVKRDLEVCEQSPADIFFVLDASSSIWPPHFDLQLKFVEDVVDEFLIGPEFAKIGVLTFGTDVRLNMDLGQFVDDEAAMKVFINSIPQLYGNTYTHDALALMRSRMEAGARPGVPHIGIVITDGESEIPAETHQQATLCKAAGITMFAVGVGSANTEELGNIASAPDMVFYVDDYTMLDNLKEQLAWKACEITTQPPPTTTTTTTSTTTTTPKPTTTTPPPQSIDGCDGTDPLDLLFAAPDDAGIIDTDYSLQFFQDIVDTLTIGERETRVGLTPRLCSGDEETGTRLPAIRLKDHDVKESLQAAIGARKLASTQLSLQLDYMLEYGFTQEDSNRANVKRAAVLVVDNKTMFPDVAVELAKQARSFEIDVIIVGVGDYVNKNELKKIAGPNAAFFVDTYEQLGTVVEKIRDHLCKHLMRP